MLKIKIWYNDFLILPLTKPVCLAFGRCIGAIVHTILGLNSQNRWFSTYICVHTENPTFWCYFRGGENRLKSFLCIPSTRLCCVLCLHVVMVECMQNMEVKLPKMVVCHPNTWSCRKPCFTGADLEGVKSVVRFFVYPQHPIVLCFMFACCNGRMHAKFSGENHKKMWFAAPKRERVHPQNCVTIPKLNLAWKTSQLCFT